jgi:ribonuclease HI
MELAGAIHGLKKVAKIDAPVWLYTDSVYVIRGITQWIWGWRRRGWKTAEGEDVANRELWQELSLVVESRPKTAPIDWRFVKGHSGVPGNERVDQIAVAFTKGTRIDLYKGPLISYPVPIFDLPASHALPEPKDKDAKVKAAAYSYVSVIDGVPMRHKTWPECEARVKGRSGAKFKKTTSAENEQEILAGWGVEL